ncbi:DNA-directed RNA polymerase I subunit RPA12 [Hoplias malabaricus]|uniref:DNA-directed RNA polymerase I subunit RPA12 n=1 Tax=Hoplias malabaricus TaxID=27720 RepID=UPI0034627478
MNALRSLSLLGIDILTCLIVRSASASSHGVSFLSRTMSCFQGDINFCPECGNILPVPVLQDVITCPRCSFKIPVQKLAGQVIKSSVVFNPLVQSSSTVDNEEDSELKGPVIDRKCSRCNKEGMVYHTRQMRSADEGQTVFFTCIHCRYQEKEDS